MKKINIRAFIIAAILAGASLLSRNAFAWSVNSVLNGLEPGIFSAIDWSATEHAKLEVGEYVEIGNAVYSVVWSDNCDGEWCRADNIFADLQQVNQTDGTPIWQDSQTKAMPLMADMTGKEGVTITHHTIWP
jgi:hypothetical protein